MLSYSLYDTVVVFDKIRENTADLQASTRRTFGEEVNLAVNQTLVRSINTMMVAILPVGAILFIGAGLLGAGTLRDLSLALFVGILIGTAATIFIAAPLYAWLRQGEPELVKQAERVRPAPRPGRRQDRLPGGAGHGLAAAVLPDRPPPGLPGGPDGPENVIRDALRPVAVSPPVIEVSCCGNTLEELTGSERCSIGRTFDAGAISTGG